MYFFSRQHVSFLLIYILLGRVCSQSQQGIQFKGILYWKACTKEINYCIFHRKWALYFTVSSILSNSVIHWFPYIRDIFLNWQDLLGTGPKSQTGPLLFFWVVLFYKVLLLLKRSLVHFMVSCNRAGRRYLPCSPLIWCDWDQYLVGYSKVD